MSGVMRRRYSVGVGEGGQKGCPLTITVSRSIGMLQDMRYKGCLKTANFLCKRSLSPYPQCWKHTIAGYHMVVFTESRSTSTIRLSKLRLSSILDKTGVISEWLNYQQALTQNRQDCVITTYSFIGVRQGLQSNLQPYQRLDKVVRTLPKISPILLLHSATALVSLRVRKGVLEHENAKRLRVKEGQRTWGLSQESSFAFIGSSVTVSLTKDLPHVYALLFSKNNDPHGRCVN